MKLNQFIHVNLMLALFFSLWVNGVAADESVEDTLEIARKQFHAAARRQKAD